MTKNSLNRNIPDSYKAFTSDDAFLSLSYNPLPKVKRSNKTTIVESIETLFDLLKISDGMTLSFHHHYRNGDLLVNIILKEIKKRELKNITLAPSAIFPVHEPLIELIKNENVTRIYTNYINGPVADAISHGHLKDLIIMDTHGGRARSIETGDITIDVAFIAASAADPLGNANGVDGQHPCGPLGYIYPDLSYAKHTVVVTDTILDTLTSHDINHIDVEYLIKIGCIGLSSGIESGTTSMTKDPIQLKIAKDTVALLDELHIIKDKMSFQTGAGSTSIAVSHFLKQKMLEKSVKGSFASGGITASLVDMYQARLFDNLFDVQSFDMTAVDSYKTNKHHKLMDASMYANPFYKNSIASQLDVVILGATEIDLDFNVNVTTSSTHKLMGGSGGHSDTAYESKLTIITTNLVKSRNTTIKKYIQTISTPGTSIDVVVTERGIAIHPRRLDLIKALKNSHLNITTIENLYQLGISITGTPETFNPKEKIIGLIRYRDGSIIDSIYEV